MSASNKHTPPPPGFLFVHVNEWATIDSPDAIPVSQGYALAALRRQGYPGAIVGDYKGSPLSPALFRQTLLGQRPAVLGFSVYEENINRVRVWARFAKKIAPDLLVVLGGPQITFMPALALDHFPEADILCRGEGETVLPALGRAIADQQPLTAVPGITFRDNDRLVDTAPAPPVEDLDELPSPYLDDIIDPTGKSRVILLTSRGCTSPCTFCYTTRASGKKVRFHSIDRVIAEITHLRHKGISDFWFADPNFAYSRRRLTELARAIIDHCPGITFWCQTRYNLIDDDLLALLQEAGAHTIAFGLESAVPAVLQKINKGLDPEKLAGVIERVQAAGIDVELFSLFGLPGESPADAQQTLDYVKARRVAIDGNSICQQLHLFFGIPMLDAPEKHGIIPLPITKPAYQSICRDFATTAMSAGEIERMAAIWRLNRVDFAEKIDSGSGLFEVAGFITGHFDAVCRRPETFIMLARIFLALEEYEAAAGCLRRLHDDFADRPEANRFLAGPFICYRFKRRGVAATGCRVIYDCKGIINGQVAPATEVYFQEAVVGGSALLADFDAGLHGMKAGRVSQFPVRFPDDYGEPALAGRTAIFQVYLHQVMEPVEIADWRDLAAQAPRNIYRFNDLDGLRRQNDNLHYLALRDSVPWKLTQEMTDFLSLLNYYLRLGFRDKADALLDLLPPDAASHEHAGRILLANNRPEAAVELLSRLAAPGAEAIINHAKALIKMQRYEEAERLVMAPHLSHDIQILDLRVGLASLTAQPVAVYLTRMNELIDRQIDSMESRSSYIQAI
ncbi:MAG: radical SAM protein [Thermodesulfobacteriota bacterium]